MKMIQDSTKTMMKNMMPEMPKTALDILWFAIIIALAVYVPQVFLGLIIGGFLTTVAIIKNREAFNKAVDAYSDCHESET